MLHTREAKLLLEAVYKYEIRFNWEWYRIVRGEEYSLSPADRNTLDDLLFNKLILLEPTPYQAKSVYVTDFGLEKMSSWSKVVLPSRNRRKRLVAV